MNTKTSPRPLSLLAYEAMRLPESITSQYAPRPGLPGAPAPSHRSIRDWIESIRMALLASADSTLVMAARIVWDDPVAADQLKDEARALLDLATEIGDLRVRA